LSDDIDNKGSPRKGREKFALMFSPKSSE